MPLEISTINQESLCLEYALCNTSTNTAQFVKTNWPLEKKADLDERGVWTLNAILYYGIIQRLSLQQLPIEMTKSFWFNQ